MEMIHESLAPCMKDGDEAQFATKTVFRFFGEFRQSLRNCLEKDIKNHPFVTQSDGVDLVRQGKGWVKNILAELALRFGADLAGLIVTSQ